MPPRRHCREPVLQLVEVIPGWGRQCATGSSTRPNGKNRMGGDTARQATAPEVRELRSEAAALKEVVAELTLENRLLKKKE